MVRPLSASALSGLRQFAATLAMLAISACASTGGIPTTPVAADGGINHIGESAAGNYLAGREAALDQDTQTAAAYFAKALAADPNNTEILERAFLLDVASGDVARAAGLAKRVNSSDSATRIARLILSVDAMKHHDYAEALKQISSTDTGDPSDVVWATVKAWADAGLGKIDDGLALMRTNNAREALGAFGLYHEALILEYAHRNAEAERAYAGALKESEGQSVRVLEAFGRFLEREGKTADAIKLYDTYLQVVPGHPVITAALARATRGGKPDALVPTPADGAAEALYGLSVVLASEHAIDLPIVYNQLALYLRPGLEPANALLGDLYEQQENWAQAIAAFQRIPDRSPVAQLAAVSIARDLARVDKTDDAIALLKKWIGRGASDADTYVTLGDLYRTQEKWDLAADAYDKALKATAPDDPAAWQIIYAKGISLERAGKWDQAEPLLQQALKLQPDQPQVLNYLGYSWIDRGENLKQALSLIDRAVAQRPDDGYVVDSLGWAYYRLGDYQSAVRYLEKAVELKADDPTINDHLGDAYWRIGRRLEARFQWSHALAFKPDDEEAKELKQKLQEGLTDTTASKAPPRSGS